MKKILLILSLLSTLALFVTACNTTSFEATKPDGTHIRITNQRLLWSSDNYAATLGTNGASLTANKSSTDSATIQAIVQGAVAGTGQALK